MVTKIDAIDTSVFVSKTQYNDTNQKKPGTSGLVKKTDYNAKISEIEGKIPCITGFPTVSALNAAKNNINNIRDLAKKTNYNAKLSDTNPFQDWPFRSHISCKDKTYNNCILPKEDQKYK